MSLRLVSNRNNALSALLAKLDRIQESMRQRGQIKYVNLVAIVAIKGKEKVFAHFYHVLGISMTSSHGPVHKK